MLRAKLGLTAAAAKGRRATEHNVAAFDLKTCQAQSPQPKVGGAPSPAVPQIWLSASPSMSRSRQRRDPLLDLAFFTESPSFQRSDRASAKCCAIYLQCCMYSLDVQNKVGIQWVHGEKINKFSESAGETLLLGCQLFSAETYRYMAQQTSAKWPRKGHALSESQPASQAIKYRKLMVGGCALTSDGPALLQTDFCSCPASANKQHEKELFYWDDFLFKSASFISFHKTTKAAGGLAARRLRLLCCADQVYSCLIHSSVLTVCTLLLSSIHAICSLAHLLSYYVFALCQVLRSDLDFTHYKNTTITILFLM